MEYKIEARGKAGQFLAGVMPSIVKQLNLQRSKAAVLVKVTNDFDGDSIGMALRVEAADCFLILLRPPKRATLETMKNLTKILAHEMVHVRQIARGMLKYAKNRDPIWMGKRYSKKTPYYDQPWEIDAYSKEELIMRRAIEK
jgi:hypothetical protein